MYWFKEWVSVALVCLVSVMDVVVFVWFVILVRTIQVQNVRSPFWDMNVLIQGVGFCGVSLSSECDGCCGFCVICNPSPDHPSPNTSGHLSGTWMYWFKEWVSVVLVCLVSVMDVVVFVWFVILVRTIQVQNVRSPFWDMNVLIQGVGFCGVSLSSECDGCCGFCVICNPSPDHPSSKRPVTFLGHECIDSRSGFLWR